MSYFIEKSQFFSTPLRDISVSTSVNEDAAKVGILAALWM
jgi:hypothetical protein